jgi:hypothetical protein
VQNEFENKLIELGFSYQCYPGDFYILCRNNDADIIIKAQLICSESSDELIYGSHNGIVIQSIGYFKLKLPTEVKEPDYFILAFQNATNHSVEFIVTTPKELKKRLIRKNLITIDNNNLELVFWLMPDNFLYNATNLSIESEWYYLSKGVNGRMVDNTDWDYTEFLNAWDRWKMV